ncbi:hypothetical protein HanRHA438_Chr13g0594781 [Helianthus annuus]|uniref:Uncharacterized protein n=1 Tax=Helianthus annuus TaxID=4232 RepID=A0A251SQS5_HELAN|nr:hypothetical protein HanXRQr2_Chr13g0584131 [Helianthus annuus]KAJ0476575.1 hypothetical protein HanHA300_Chr13g0478881 [Helianthus annuus]KAJ0497400.1 hypothetical protein HanHA89_Chr13g0510981 [Helianthus annuus]KAJ0663413.1 hypothetical protein HanLR1_Chr13g0480971 [Helianthus annuus]KAJ0848856.1 hypothetical protein HanPSC8_Chr13g0562351 [Helianthus annuus]
MSQKPTNNCYLPPIVPCVFLKSLITCWYSSSMVPCLHLITLRVRCMFFLSD